MNNKKIAICDITLAEIKDRYKKDKSEIKNPEIFKIISENLEDLKNQDVERRQEYREILRFIYSKGFDFNINKAESEYNGTGNTGLMWSISYGRAVSQEFSLSLLQDLKADPIY